MFMEDLMAVMDETQQELGDGRRQDALNRQTAVRLSELSQMPICPHCQEQTPDMLNCPFCEDMAEQASRESAHEVVRLLVGLMGMREMETADA